MKDDISKEKRVERIEAMLGKEFSGHYEPEAYAIMLRSSRIGLNCFGMGFDTVRYWELPAHGAMLLSERLPIRIPENFVDGESAVFFDTVQELEEKLAYYLAQPEESAEIAAAGADTFVAGSAIFNAPDYATVIAEMREALAGA